MNPDAITSKSTPIGKPIMPNTTKDCVIGGALISGYPTTSLRAGKLSNALTMALGHRQNIHRTYALMTPKNFGNRLSLPLGLTH